MYTKDETGTIKCPHCLQGDELVYHEYHEARIHWESALYPQHEEVGTLMNYECRNCGFQFIVVRGVHELFNKQSESTGND